LDFICKSGNQTLHLGPYVGAETDHTVIPLGKAYGQVAVSNNNFVVADVAAQDNYIACSFTVKSEVVVPLCKWAKYYKQIDIDSHVLTHLLQLTNVLEFVNQEMCRFISAKSFLHLEP
jgi:GAF domain-containing protein